MNDNIVQKQNRDLRRLIDRLKFELASFRLMSNVHEDHVAREDFMFEDEFRNYLLTLEEVHEECEQLIKTLEEKLRLWEK